MTESHSSHLSRQKLTEIDGIDDILENLKEYLVRVEFKEGKHKGEEYCAAKDLPEAARPLFVVLGLNEV